MLPIAMTEACVGAGISATGLAVIAQLDPITAGEKLGTLSSAAFLGVALVVCVGVIAKMYLAGETRHQQHSEKLIMLIETSVAQVQASTDATKANTAVLIEVKEQMSANSKAVEQCSEIRKAELMKLVKP